MKLLELREKLVEAGGRIYRDGFVRDMQGNISVYDEESKLIAITPSQMPYHGRRPEDMCVIDLNGEVIEGGNPSSEIALHTRLYKTMPGVKAIIHTHPLHICAFSVAEAPIPQVLADITRGFHGNVPVAGFVTPGTPEVADVALKTMRSSGSCCCVLAHHGFIVATPTLQQSLKVTYAIEDEARMILLAKAANLPVKTLS